MMTLYERVTEFMQDNFSSSHGCEVSEGTPKYAGGISPDGHAIQFGAERPSGEHLQQGQAVTSRPLCADSFTDSEIERIAKRLEETCDVCCERLSHAECDCGKRVCNACLVKSDSVFGNFCSHECAEAAEWEAERRTN